MRDVTSLQTHRHVATVKRYKSYRSLDPLYLRMRSILVKSNNDIIREQASYPAGLEILSLHERSLHLRNKLTQFQPLVLVQREAKISSFQWIPIIKLYCS